MQKIQKKSIIKISIVLLVLLSTIYVFTQNTAKADTTYNKAPVAIINGPDKWPVNMECSFDGSDSYDVDGNILEYEWQFCEIFPFESKSSDPIGKKTFSSVGEWKIKLRVTDDKGKTFIDTHILEVIESNLPPNEHNSGQSTGLYTVEKKVWNGAAWAEYAEVNLGEIVQFQVKIDNPSNYVIEWSGKVFDNLPPNLEYIEMSSTIYPEDYPEIPFPEYVDWDNNIVTWEEPLPIRPFQNLTFTFDTIAVGCGIGTNTVTASPGMMIPVQRLDDDMGFIYMPVDVSDTATVNVICEPCGPEVAIEKLIWNGCDWAKTANVNIGDTVHFKGIVYNPSDCYSVEFSGVVFDQLPDNLRYINGSSTIYNGYGGDIPSGSFEEVDLENNIVYWHEPPSIMPHKNLTFYYDTKAVDCGPGTNNLTAHPDRFYPINPSDPAMENPDGYYDVSDHASVNVICDTPEITIEKQVWNGCTWANYTEVGLGDIVQFRSIIQNPSEYYPLEFSGDIWDQFPNNLKYINESALESLPEGSVEDYYGNNLIHWRPSEVIHPQENLTFYFNATAVDCELGINEIIVEAHYTINNEEIDVSDSDDASVYVLCGEPNIDIKKYVLMDYGRPEYMWVKNITSSINDIVTFKIIVKNTGYIPLDIVVYDELPKELIYNNNATPWEPNDIKYPLNGNIIYIWEYPKLQPDQSFIIEFTAIVDECGEHINNVQVIAESAEHEDLEDSDYATVYVECKLDPIVVEKQVWNGCTWADYAEVNLGDTVQFKVDIYNPNEEYEIDWSGVIYDIFPENLRYINGSAEDSLFTEIEWAEEIIDWGWQRASKEVVDWINNTVYWYGAPNIPPLRYLSFTFNATAVSCGPGTNNVTGHPTSLVYLEGGEMKGLRILPPGSLDASDEATVHVMCEPNIILDKKVKENCCGTFEDEITIKQADWVTYKITLTNTGNDILHNVIVTDTLPPGITYQGDAHADPKPTGNINNKILTWDLGTLNPQNSKTITYRADINKNKCGTFINNAKVNAKDPYQKTVTDTDRAIIHKPCGEPCLKYDPEKLDFGYMEECEHATRIFDIWNGGQGELEYSLSWECEWITKVTPQGGNSKGEHDKIRVSIYTEGMVRGETYTCKIKIKSNGGNGILELTVTIGEETQLRLKYNPKSHNFGNMQPGQTDTINFEIWNDHEETLTYTLTEDCNWVNVSPTQGSSSNGVRDTITVTIDTADLTQEVYTCHIQINSNGGNGIFNLTVNIQESGEYPCLEYDPEEHDFGTMKPGEIDSTTFEIWNGRTGMLNYTLIEDSNWMSLSSNSGNSTGERDTITINIDTTDLIEGTHTYNIHINSNGGDGIFKVTVRIQESGEQEPNIEITKPKDFTLYFRNEEKIVFPINLIIGPITIETNATDADGEITKVQFIIDEELKDEVTEGPYTYNWNERIFGMKTIRVKAYDNDGLTAEDEIAVFILNFGFTGL